MSYGSRGHRDGEGQHPQRRGAHIHGLSRRHLILLPLLACACQSYHVVLLEPRNSGSLPTHSWVSLTRGVRVPVEGGYFTRDSVFGTQGGDRRFAVSRDSVTFVEERRLNTLGTMKGIGTGALLVVLALTALLVSSIPGN
jgi:hypothetical protein